MVNKYSEDKLGIKITVGSVKVSPFPGSARVQDLTIHNPEGFKKTDHLMNVKDAVINISTCTALCSFGKNIVIEHVAVDQVNCQIESKLEKHGFIPKPMTNDKR